MIPNVFLTNTEAHLTNRKEKPISRTTHDDGSNSSEARPQSSSWQGRWTDGESDQDWWISGWGKFCQSALGHAPYIWKIIGRVENPKWLIVVNIFHSIFLSISSTVFVSNPLSGLIILIAMLIYSAEKAALLGLVSLCFGILSCIWPLRLHIPMHLLIGGSITFNCFLLGSSLLPLVGTGMTHSWQDVGLLIPLAAVLGIFVVYLWCGLNGILSRMDVPVLNAPTNILALLLFYSGCFSQRISAQENYEFLPNSSRLIKSDVSLSSESSTFSSFKNSETLNPTACNCSISDQLWDGIILSQGIIFQVGVPQSYVIYLTILIYSPILFCQEILGALIGTLIGIGLEGPCGTDVCNGSWGYNSLLTAGAIGGLLIRFNLHSLFLSVMGALLSGIFTAVFKKNDVPVLGLPFMIATWLLLPLANRLPESDTMSKLSCLDLQRVVEFSTPELNSIFKTKLYSQEKYITPKSSILHI